MSQAFQQDVFIPFHYVDAAGIAFFGHAFTLAHQTFEAFVVEALHCPWQHWFHHPERIVPIKNTQANYFAPLLAGQACQIRLRIEELRTSSFCTHYDFFQNERHCCTVKMVHVFCDRLKQQKIPIPSELLTTLKTILHE